MQAGTARSLSVRLSWNVSKLQSVKVPLHAPNLGYAGSHLRIGALVLLGDLVHYELGIALHQQVADSQPGGRSQPGKEALVFCHVVRGSEVQLNGIF